jgi:hypothetical protein
MILNFWLAMVTRLLPRWSAENSAVYTAKALPVSATPVQLMKPSYGITTPDRCQKTNVLDKTYGPSIV